MAVSSADLVQVALHLCNMDTLPADSSIQVPGEALTKVLFGIDLSLIHI